MNSIFTVIIPVYNKGPHLERSINSVFAQTCKDYELIIIDDASTDDSLEIIKRAIKGKTQVKLLNRKEPGPGGYAARNLGIAEAQSDWIAFLDADDEWEPGLLEEYKRLIVKYPDFAFFSTAYRRVSPDGKISCDPYTKSQNHPKEIIFNLLSYSKAGGKGNNPLSTISVTVRRSLLSEIGGFPADRCVRGGDRDTWLRLLMTSNLVWSPYIGAIYYRDSVNMVTQNLSPQIQMCKDETYKRILDNLKLRKKWGYKLSWTIMGQSNYERRLPLKNKIKSGTLSSEDVKKLYFLRNPLYTSQLFFWSLLDPIVQKKLITYILRVLGKSIN